MINTWRKLLAAAPQDRRLAAEALALLVTARCGLWLLPLATLRRLLAVWARPGRGATRSPDRVAWSVAATTRRLPSPFRDCLPQALVAEAMLKRHGAPAELLIGVRRRGDAKRVEAHAWVVSGERVVTGWLDDLADYVPLASRRPGS